MNVMFERADTISMLELNQRVIFISKDCLLIVMKYWKKLNLYLIDWMYDFELLLTSEK